jgi:hypothetical protein
MTKKPDPAILIRLNSPSEEVVLHTLHELRSTGSPAYIPILAEMLLTGNPGEIRNGILSLMGELKEKESAQVLVETIQNDHFLPVRKELIAACWQNGLDYSPWLSQFVDWVIQHEMEIAFEAFTVIENLETFPVAEIREDEIRKINQALQDADQVKAYLLKELRGIIA